jgi:hypothetical protein
VQKKEARDHSIFEEGKGVSINKNFFTWDGEERSFGVLRRFLFRLNQRPSQ